MLSKVLFNIILIIGHLNTNQKKVSLQPMRSSSYKTISSLRKRIILFFFILVFIFPGLDQFFHLWHNSSHKHHQLHIEQDLHFHASSDHCYILTFEYTSLSNDIILPIIYSCFIPISSHYQSLIPKLFQESLFRLTSPRAPPINK